MYRPFHPLLTSAFLSLSALASCQKDAATTPAPGLEGTWRLTNRQCYCVPAPLPDETVTFTATRFTFYNGNRATHFGAYSFTTAAPFCSGGGAVVPALHLTDSNTGQAPANVPYRLAGTTLTLDYGGPCDAPVDTYERLQ